MAQLLEAQTPPPPLEQSRPHCGHCRDNGETCLIFGGVRAIAGGTWRNPTAANLETAGNELARAAIRLQEAALDDPEGTPPSVYYAAEWTVHPEAPGMKDATAALCPQVEQAGKVYDHLKALDPRQE